MEYNQNISNFRANVAIGIYLKSLPPYTSYPLRDADCFRQLPSFVYAPSQFWPPSVNLFYLLCETNNTSLLN